MTLRAPLSVSPSMAGKLLLAGKKAKKFGDCQCVSPASIRIPLKKHCILALQRQARWLYMG